MFEQIIPAIYEGFQVITPAGVGPEFFWPSFLLVFAIVHSIMEKTKIFGESQDSQKKGVYLVIALVLAYFTASSAFATLVIGKMAPQLGMVLVAVLSFVMIFALFSGGDTFGRDKNLQHVMYLLVIIGAGYVLWSTFAGVAMETGGAAPELTNFLTPTDMGIVLALIAIIIIVYFLLK